MRPLFALRATLAVPAAFAAAAAGYSLALLVSARRGNPPPDADGGEHPPLRLVALVPAHDEETTIGATLDALSAIDYPDEAWRVCVVADNCTDATAAIARERGAQVIERDETDRRGKGYALRLGMDTLLADPEQVDAIVVIDADCRPTPDLAAEIARSLRAGAAATQSSYVVANPSESTYSALRFAAFAAINVIRPKGRDRLGMSAGLLGTGMSFSRALLERHPWSAFGLAEDGEFHLTLVAAGERVRFAGGAVESPMPTSFDDAASQQSRWESGRLALIRTWLPRLLGDAARRRDLVPAVAALDLITPPLSITVAGTLGTTIMAALLRARRPFRLSLLALIGHAVYVFGSLTAVGAPRSTYRSLLAAPLLALRELAIVLNIARGRGPSEWKRTTRATRESSG
jgi:1,2-diacylglycerol 3-beta-glucosyltransferase